MGKLRILVVALMFGIVSIFGSFVFAEPEEVADTQTKIEEQKSDDGWLARRYRRGGSYRYKAPRKKYVYRNRHRHYHSGCFISSTME